jgi:hypothetical protein
MLTEQRTTRGRPRTGSCSGLLPSRSPSDFQYLRRRGRCERAVACEGGAGAARGARHRVANGAVARTPRAPACESALARHLGCWVQ